MTKVVVESVVVEVVASVVVEVATSASSRSERLCFHRARTGLSGILNLGLLVGIYGALESLVCGSCNQRCRFVVLCVGAVSGLGYRIHSLCVEG